MTIGVAPHQLDFKVSVIGAGLTLRFSAAFRMTNPFRPCNDPAPIYGSSLIGAGQAIREGIRNNEQGILNKEVSVAVTATAKQSPDKIGD